MITINKNHILMILCMITVAILCIGQVMVNTVLIIAAMVLFMITVIYSALDGKALYILCYFIPWSPLIKFQPGTTSLYSIGIIGICLLTWIRYRFAFKKYIIPAVALVMYIVIVKMCLGFSIDNSFILFSILLIMFPVMGLELDKKYDFYHLNLFFSLGIIGASLSAYFLAPYSTIARFIDVSSFREVTRYSGYYGDANFYSAHVAAALAGLLTIFLKYRKKIVSTVVLSVVLCYCGLISASKSFVITICGMFLLWVLHIIRMRKKISYKVLIVILISFVVVGVLLSGVFSEVLDIIFIRFGSVKNITDLTTGRNNIWNDYFKYFYDNPATVIFGKGFTNIMVDGRASHNSLLQSIFQFGIVGSLIFVLWIKWVLDTISVKFNLDKNEYLLYATILVGVFLPWMGIDMLFRDELFLMMVYIYLGFNFISSQTD